MGELALGEQIACVSREIAMRERVYPRWVESGRMTQEKADQELATMRAVRATLVAEQERRDQREFELG